ncbi:acetyl-CoA carboxylase, biotin carboxyl carrier protein [Clostridium isatidis]|uniref:Biotin carboxyl carrier protein of acetyl-CoA carboxylase n=1 Tax=Clostridium isatidis TaxID=182773 RepID=A0A343JG38_9CLOT|nr:acetyl-CoA carboxylase, biotin carboxyl carrier protein [Clostridium isatidis]
MNYDQIQELIKSIDASSLRVFELELQGTKLRLSKNNETFKESVKEIKEEIENYESIPGASINKEETKEDIKIDSKKEENLKVVKSPLVGTYYSSPAPGEKPYVEVGSKVKKGDVLCIVEAMKIMNEITSDYDGEIVEILRRDEDIIEYGMELFKIR